MQQNPTPPNGPGQPPGHPPGQMDGAAAPAAGRIRHNAPGFGSKGSGDPEAVPVVQSEGPTRTNKITAFGKTRRHEEEWTRTPNTTGNGAIHVKTFHAKLTDDALSYMDQCINEWLDAHPQYEVKFVNATVGTLTGKLKEPHIICQVWV